MFSIQTLLVGALKTPGFAIYVILVFRDTKRKYLFFKFQKSSVQVIFEICEELGDMPTSNGNKTHEV